MAVPALPKWPPLLMVCIYIFVYLSVLYLTDYNFISEGAVSPAYADTQRRAEQLVLYIRALQLLSSALNLSKEELQAERLHPSPSVKQVFIYFGREIYLFYQLIYSLGGVDAEPKISSLLVSMQAAQRAVACRSIG